MTDRSMCGPLCLLAGHLCYRTTIVHIGLFHVLVHAKTEGKGLIAQICAFACTTVCIDAFCCRCFLQIQVDDNVKDKPDQCVS